MRHSKFEIGQEVYGTVTKYTGLRSISLRGDDVQHEVMEALVLARKEPGLFDPVAVRFQRILVAFRCDEPYREPRHGTKFRATIGDLYFEGMFPRIGNRRAIYNLAEFEAGRTIPDELYEALKKPNYRAVFARYFKCAKSAVHALKIS